MRAAPNKKCVSALAQPSFLLFHIRVTCSITLQRSLLPIHLRLCLSPGVVSSITFLKDLSGSPMSFVTSRSAGHSKLCTVHFWRHVLWVTFYEETALIGSYFGACKTALNGRRCNFQLSLQHSTHAALSGSAWSQALRNAFVYAARLSLYTTSS